ncbi:MAG: hypothetical protein EXR75_10070 [Myxococcales bacterium]|nr:hypothetical protein [Myxococcales bacterium]
MVLPKQAPWIWLAALAGLACSATSRSKFEDGSGGSTGALMSGGEGAAGGELGLMAGSGGSGPSATSGGSSDCSDAAKLVYLLTDTNEIYSFAPLDKKLTKLGALNCPTPMQPNSMAVSRDAVAWINYVGFGDVEGALFRVDLATLSCEAQPAVKLNSNWARLGMGFSTDGVDSTSETLYVASVSAAGQLGKIANGAVTAIGSFTGIFAGQSAELTGTGDARLYAFFTTTPVHAVELGKANAGILSSVPLPTVEVPSAWAFSFWGGDFYLYTASFTNSRVNRYRPSDGSVDTSYISDTGMRIVGAGVSTCAPVDAPK